ncbi:ubiquitin carboxyl-terminal hydrolase, putative [Entamoeba invadens IP1]|uniref:ubiquitin carboxyl-terminal hydrolase, putative n=1 Tax=Entamoeba invadens IP1 TaxID=370355 RepID=UPI0002C3E9D8|nr:ubiquitin carboxyl-terminal hydrolase, putative [Entamoeba invadens IP1]ELP93114.1 ubiquitin carboxyl-terminal hydrolase, putative [Entamoeba invadens IP1]|eukprot:XP_004259885.1 ubiquitin carboxyl-terminal hydrolase, putative [Entamoeba invadens IP1]
MLPTKDPNQFNETTMVQENDFMTAIFHAKKCEKFPQDYRKELTPNHIEKFRAVPKQFSDQVQKCAGNYLDKISITERSHMEDEMKLPDIDDSTGLIDDSDHIKDDYKEGVDYVLLSKKNFDFMKKIYLYVRPNTRFPALPVVYIEKLQNSFARYTEKDEVILKLTVKALDGTQREEERKVKLFTCVSLQTTIKKLKKLFKAEIIFENYDVVVTDGDKVVDTNKTVKSIIGNTHTLTAVIEEKAKPTFPDPEPETDLYPSHGVEDAAPSLSAYSSSCTATDYNKYTSSNYNKYTSSSYRNYYDDEKTKDGTKGVCGLRNLGNTCFMNSALQCLLHTMPLNEFFNTANWSDDINTDNPLGTGGKLVNAWKVLLDKYWGGYSVLSPREFKSAIGEFAPQFSGYQQQDSQELLSFLVDGIHEDLNKVKKKPYVEIPDYNGEGDEVWAQEEWKRYKMRNDSIITTLFAGQFKSNVVCDVCKHVNLRFDPYVFISLQLPNKMSTVSFNVYDKEFRHSKKAKVSVKGKTFEQIVEEGLKSASFTQDPKDFIVVELGYGNEVKGVVDKDTPIQIGCEYGIVEKQDKCEEFVVYDTKVNYSSYRDFRMPVVFDKKKSLEEVDKALVVLFKDDYKVSSYSYYNRTETNEKKEEKKDEKKGDTTPPTGTKNTETISNAKTENNETKEVVVSNNNKEKESSNNNMTNADAAKNAEKDDEKKEVSKKEEEQIQKKEEKYINAFEYKAVSSGIVQAVNIAKEGYRYIIQPYSSYYNTEETDPVTLYECFELFEEEEHLTGDNTVYCSTCKTHQTCKKKMDIWSTNEILVIHLKRFGSVGGSVRDKISTLVDFPIYDLDLTQYVKKYDPKTPPIYNLYAVSNHSGSLGGGHYVASARVGKDWYDFNDSSTSKIGEASIVSKSAYVLYYIRKDVDTYTGDVQKAEKKHED